jgi:hypothetical protein
MRIVLAALAMAALVTGPGFGQTGKTFYFTPPVTPADMTAMATAIRTIVDLPDISVDEAHEALVAQGPVDRLVASRWLFDQLDRAGAGATAQYKMSGGKEEAIAVFRVSPAATVADLTALTTAIRTVTDIPRLFPYERQMAIVARDTPEKIAAADWVVRQLSPYNGDAPSVDSPAYPLASERPDEANGDWSIRVFRMDPKTTDSQLTSMVTAIRTVADLQRVFPFGSGKALIARGSPAQMAVAEWLVHELAKPAGASTVHQTTMPGLIDGVVRLFYVGQQMDVTPLVTQLRSEVGIIRIFPFGNPSAVVLRGRPDQMSSVEALVAKFMADELRR